MDGDNFNVSLEEVEAGTMSSDVSAATASSGAEDKNRSDSKPKAVNLGSVLLDRVPELLSKAAYRDRDQGFIREAASKLLSTLMAINELDEFSSTVRVKGTPVPLSSYNIWEGFEAFLAPKKVAVSADNDDELDLVVRTEYHVSGAVLDAEAFNSLQASMLRKMVRFKHSVVALDRKAGNITTDINNAATRSGVRKTDQSKVIPLKRGLLYAEAYQVSIERWLDRWLDLNVWTKEG